MKAKGQLGRTIARWVLGVAMVGVGVTHFTSPAAFAAMIPKLLPAPLALVYVSGVAEIAGGIGILVPRVRKLASFGLVALYVAVFPANIYMAVEDLPAFGGHVPAWALWARLPFQFLFIAWALWVGKPDPTTKDTA